MGGGDKALLPLGGRPLLAHVVERLAPQVAEIVLNANDDPGRFAAFGLPLVPDRLAARWARLPAFMPASPGPRRTGRRALRHHRRRRHALLSRRSGEPALRGDDMTNPTLVVARSESGVHPVFGLWPVSLAPHLEESLRRGARKALDFVTAHQAKEVAFPPVEIGGRAVDPFFNINRPEDLAEAEVLLSATAPAPRQR